LDANKDKTEEMDERKYKVLKMEAALKYNLCSFAVSIWEIIQVMENRTFKSFPLTFLSCFLILPVLYTSPVYLLPSSMSV